MKMQMSHYHETHYFSLKAVLLTLIALLVFQVSFAANDTNKDQQQEDLTALEVFQLEIIGEQVHLEWNATPDAELFEIEVASEIDEKGNLVFEKVDEITAANSDSYNFIDSKTIKEGLLYYRVHQKTNEGEQITSDIRTANFIYKDNFTLNVHTDEFLSDLELHINSRSSGKAALSIAGVNSDFTLAKQINIEEGVNKIAVELDKDLPKGNYLLTFAYNGDTQYMMIEKKKDSSLIVVSEK